MITISAERIAQIEARGDELQALMASGALDLLRSMRIFIHTHGA
jgi:hypothetical protein